MTIPKALLVLGLAMGGLLLEAEQGQSRLLSLGSGWEHLSVPRIAATQFHFVAEEDAVEIVADRSASFFYRRLNAEDQVSPHLKWEWRVDQSAPPTDQSIVGEDDRSLAIHLWFEDEGERGSFFGFFARVFGYPKIGHVLTYVWGGTQSRDTMIVNPFHEGGRIVILRAAGSPEKEWMSEQRNIVADFMAGFGRPPDLSKLRYIAISADTDDTNSLSRAYLRRLGFVGEDETLIRKMGEHDGAPS